MLSIKQFIKLSMNSEKTTHANIELFCWRSLPIVSEPFTLKQVLSDLVIQKIQEHSLHINLEQLIIKF
jgi:hypothetical protein